MAERRVSHYQLIRLLGKGGMGEVFLAKDTRLDRSVALKLMSAELARDPNQRLRFETEAKSASGLNHPHICTVHEVGESEDQRPFIVMEYVDGETLDKACQQRKLKIREIIDIGIQLADALETAHSRHLLHRDVKPGNIMLNKRREAKLLDFGLAKQFRSESPVPGGKSLSHTETGFSIGTPHYMSPEQALGRELDHRSDIFNVGVVLYELITGNRPFQGSTVGETINSIINQEPAPLGLENPKYTPAIDRIVFKCLEKDPAKRYSTAKALADDLRELKSAAANVGQSATRPQPASAADDGTKLWQLPHRVANQPLPWLAGALAGAAIIIAIGLIFHGVVRKTAVNPTVAAGQGPAGKSIAVLPFDNISAEANTEYLSDGFTEEITTALSRVPGLKVVARNSAFAFKGKKEDSRKIGETLHVSTLLEGSIQKAGQQIRITARLVNAADGFQLWSQTYDRGMEDIITVQEDIARRIAEQLQPTEHGTVVKAKAIDPEVYKLYLQGRQYWNKRTEPALREAITLYKKALDKDPTYADAYAGMAAAYCVLPGYSFSSRASELMPIARAAANRALELDASNPEAHAVLGNLAADQGGFSEAEQHLKQAIANDPNYATGHHWYGRYLDCRGRMQEGFKELQKAVDLDPLSPIIHATIPDWYLINEQYDRALQEADKVIDQFPEFAHAHMIKVEAFLLQNRFKEALDEIEKARALMPEDPFALLDARAFAFARMGNEAEAKKILEQLKEQLKQGKRAEFPIAVVYIGLGQYDQALDQLEKLSASGNLEFGFNVEPIMRELRNLPRFQNLLEKSRLKGEAKA
jgi:TolB-like protein/Flp pilus assembly protein TadD/predicted Ser/Thr protein kinase